jgi:hypothetical protein
MNRINKMLAGLTLCAALSASALHAEDRAQRQGLGKLWWSSVAAVVAGSALDAHSSWGRQELNPVLRGANGEFGMRAVAIKAAIAGGVVGVQYLLLRKNPGAAGHAAVANFAMAGVFGGVAYYNHTNHRAFSSPAAPSRPTYLAAAGGSAAE